MATISPNDTHIQEKSTRLAQNAYNRINTHIASKGCTLLTTIQDIQDNKMHAKSFYKIIGICGHESYIKYDMFKAMNCGIKCKSCTLESTINKLKVKGLNASNTEYKGYCYLRDQLINIFQVKKMVEGTQADFAIKPLETDEDMWLPIQLKTSLNIKINHCNNYHFRIGRTDYPNMIVVLLCLEDKKTWILNGNDIIGKQNINIGSTRSIYSQYEVNDIITTFMKLYTTQEKYNIAILNIPKSAQQQREQKYRHLREQYIPYLSFTYPEEEHLPYDFIVNGFKVQEKVATKSRNKRSNTSYIVVMARCAGKNKIAYSKGDNAYYWINIPDTTKFFLIPEMALLEHGKIIPNCICTNGFLMGINIRYLPKSQNNWMYQYMYDYTTITQDQMMQLFALT
jgi:hypothetical protein